MYKAEWLYTVAVKCCTTVVQRRSGECEKCRDKYINTCERASSISSYVCAYIFSFLSCLLLPLSAVPAGGDAAKCEYHSSFSTFTKMSILMSIILRIILLS